MRSLKALVIGFACLPIMPYASHAARIYNQSSQTINVEGQGGPHITLAPKAQSDSLDWPLVNQISVFGGSGTAALCNLDFGTHAQIQGGNYMIVAPGSGHTNCGVCDSNHKVINGQAHC